MKIRMQIRVLHIAIITVNLPLIVCSGLTWRLERVRAGLQTQLDNFEADEQR